jgi:hypothetical protein
LDAVPAHPAHIARAAANKPRAPPATIDDMLFPFLLSRSKVIKVYICPKRQSKQYHPFDAPVLKNVSLKAGVKGGILKK